MKQKSRCFEEIMYYRFADKELEPERAQKIKQHLDVCPGCSAFVAAIEAENRSLKEMFAAAPAGPDLTHRIMNRLEKKKTISMPLRRLAYAASFVLIIFLSIFFLLHGPAPKSPQDHQVLVRSARVEGRTAQAHIFESEDPDVKFIWLEKFEEKEMEGTNEAII